MAEKNIDDSELAEVSGAGDALSGLEDGGGGDTGGGATGGGSSGGSTGDDTTDAGISGTGSFDQRSGLEGPE